jgi:S-adenosylmethionine:tRNA ribosyltransferase-isomerase
LLDRDDHPTTLTAEISAVLSGSLREVTFNLPLDDILEELGHAPLPPYIHEKLADPERYQTVYARRSGSAAAPTAGLHFTPELLIALRRQGVLFETVTLHVGLDTFKPVDVNDVADHVIHSEWATLKPETAKRINETKLSGGRVIAVGTTTVRTLETAALRSAEITGSLKEISSLDAGGVTFDYCPWRPVIAFEGYTDLFIYPGYRFRAVDALITNFHLPRSTLLMLVSAFAGKRQILETYQKAIELGYRFYSFGDAMFIC